MMNNQNLPLDMTSVRAFDAVATHLNFRRAAAAVALSPAALSTRVRELEDELGAALFVRTTRSVRLTAAGERVQRAAREALLHSAAIRTAASSQAEAPFSFTLGTRFELGLSWLVPQLTALHAARPARTLHVDFGDSAELLGKVQRSAIDAAITSARFSVAALTAVPLHKEDYIFVASARLLKKQPLKKAADAAAHVLLDADRSLPLFRYFREAAPNDEQWGFADVQLLASIAALRARVLAGAGVAVLPHYLVRADLQRGVLRQLLPARALPHDWFRLVFRSDHPRAADLASLATELKRAPLQ